MTSPIRVLLVDDHPLIRAGVRSVLEDEADIEVVAEAATTEGLEQLCQQLQPDVVLLDLRVPGPPPSETIERLKNLSRPPRILLLSAYEDDVYIRLALTSKVNGYVLKDEMPETVVKAIRVVVNQGMWFSKSVAQKFHFLTALNESHFTSREIEVLKLLAEGLSNEEIADRTGLAYQTVRNYVSRLYSKLGVRSRAEAVRLARQLPFISDEC